MELFADVAMLSRIQFAATVAYHFFFVPLTIGLGLILAINETRYYRSRNEKGRGGHPVLGEDLHRDVRDRRGHGHHDGVLLRNQLGRLLPLRRRHLRRAARGRGPAGLLLWSRCSWASCCSGARRVSPKFYLVSGLARLARLVPVRPVDPHRELVDADAGRRRAGRRRVSKAVITDFLAAACEPLASWARYTHTWWTRCSSWARSPPWP